MHLIRALFTAAWFTLAATGFAHAEPITISLFGAAIASSWVGTAITAGITALIGFGINYVAGLLTRAAEPDQKQPGLRLQVQVGDASPFAFPMGRAAVAGTRKYIGTWGQDGETPNAYLTDVIQLSDIYAPNLDGFWAMKQRCSILWDQSIDLGAPVAEFRVNGKDHMWVRLNSDNTSADSLLLAKFSGSERPWTGDMIGRGCTYAVITTLVNRELFTSVPDFLFEPAAMPLYDLRKDSTNGGSGSHRWGNPATYEPTTNPAVIIYNLVRGIYRDGEWQYGGQNLPAFRLPPSSWMAAANECDVQIPIATGGTENQFRCGTEVRGDIEPLTLIQSLLQGCNGRMAEVGGKFEILIGAPGAAVFALSDDDIVITRGQSFTPFPSLQETHNGIEATYPEPTEMWASKDAPARYSPDLEADDGNRRLATGVNFPTVPYPVQVQRLMKAMIEEERRFRIHSITLGPEAWVLTPNSVLSWSSARNGYVNKKFLLVRIVGEPGMLQQVLLKEIDPNDYSWSSDDELDVPTGELGILRPPTQVIVGWAVTPETIYDSGGKARRPAVRFSWDGTVADVRAVGFQLRTKASSALVFDDSTDNVAAGTIVVASAAILPNQELQGRGIYRPFSGRPTDWTEWLDVTTPDVRFGAFDLYEGVIGFEHLAEDLVEYQKFVREDLRDLIAEAQRISMLTADQDLGNYKQIESTRRDVTLQVGAVKALFMETITLAIGPGSALAQQLTQLDTEIDGKASSGVVNLLQSTVTTLDDDLDDLSADVEATADAVLALTATVGGISATANFRASVYAGRDGYSSRIGLEARVGGAGTYRAASLFLDVPASAASPTRVAILADQFVVATSAIGTAFTPFIVQAGVVYIDKARIRDLTGDQIRVNSIDAGQYLLNGTIISEKLGADSISGGVATAVSGPQILSGSPFNVVNGPIVSNRGTTGTRNLVIGIGQYRTSGANANFTGVGEVKMFENGFELRKKTFLIDDNYGADFIMLAIHNNPPSSASYYMTGLVGGGGGGGCLLDQCQILVLPLKG